MRSTSAVFVAACLFSRAITALPFYNYSVFTNASNHWSPQTTIDYPNTIAFDEATERWNNFSGPSYSIAITPAVEEDVAKAVSIARSINLPFLGTGGRHGSSLTLDQVNGGLAIDLSGLNGISVDAEAATITVGGGNRLSDVYDPVYNAGYTLPVGSCACPGILGVSLGAGVGRYQGLHGLMLDNLLSARLVTAEGNLIDVSADSNSDLFWGIRGAGHNFGIVTSAVFRIHPLINGGQVMNADIVLPAAANASYFDALQALEENMPAELATITIMEYNSTTGEAQLLANWVYIGPEDIGRQYIAPLLDLNPSLVNISMVAYNKLVNVALQGLGRSICTPTFVSGYGVNYRNLSSSTFQTAFRKVNDFYVDYPDGRNSGIEMEIFAPQAVEAVAQDATAYPWRDTRGFALISAGWNSTATEQAGEALMREIRADYVATSGFGNFSVYVNYGHGDETPEQVFGPALPRLQTLKKQWDPDNVFRFWHAIPTQ